MFRKASTHRSKRISVVVKASPTRNIIRLAPAACFLDRIVYRWYSSPERSPANEDRAKLVTAALREGKGKIAPGLGVGTVSPQRRFP
jgi:hypothetical protein